MQLEFPYSFLLAAELDTAAGRISTHVTEHLPDEPLIQQIINLIAADRAAVQRALANSRGSALTARIAEADEVRDDAFVVFRNACENATRRRTKPDHVVAGELLVRIIRGHGYSLQDFGNTNETGALTALFASLQAADAAAAVILIGAGDLLAELKTAQDDFEKILNSRDDEQAAKDYPLLVTAKTTLGKRLQMLLGLIAALDSADRTNARPELDILISRINEVITEVFAPARARRTRANTPEEPKPTATA